MALISNLTENLKEAIPAVGSGTATTSRLARYHLKFTSAGATDVLNLSTVDSNISSLWSINPAAAIAGVINSGTALTSTGGTSLTTAGGAGIYTATIVAKLT